MNSPLMCLGMPRSGTTWVAKIIDSHPTVHYNHEPDSVYMDKLKGIKLLPESFTVEQKKQVKELISGIPYTHEKCIGKRPFLHKSYRGVLAERYFQLSILATKVARINIVPSQQKYRQNDAVNLMFKSIESTGRVKLFLESVTDLKIIFIVRSVFGQINSVLKGTSAGEFCDNAMNHVEADELTHLFNVHGEKNNHDLSRVLQYNPIEQLAYKWLVYNEKALAEAKEYPDRVKVVSYDELCDHPLEKSKDLFSFFGLDYHDQCQNFIKASTSSHSETFYSVNKDPKKAKAGWKKNINDEQVESVHAIIQGSLAQQAMVS